MSLLLEALQRADSERKDQGDVPGIDTQHPVATQAQPENSRHWMLPVLALIILLLVVYVIYLQSTRTAVQGSPAAEAPVVTQNGEHAPSRHQTAQPEAHTVPTALETPASTEAQPAPNTSQADVAALYERLNAENVSGDVTQGSDATQVAIAEQSTAVIEQGFIEEYDERSATIDQDNAAEEVYSSIPFASQLPDQQQRSIPSLRYTTHGYAKATGKGLVTLNGRSQRRGDTIAPGLILLDIRADYIVLDMNGVLFRLPAATDWN